MRHSGSVGNRAARSGDRAMRLAGVGAAMLGLAACASLRADDQDLIGRADEAQWNAVRAAELEVEISELKAEKETLSGRVAELQSKLKTQGAEKAVAEAALAATAAPPPSATPVKPATVVAAADVNRALANSPAPPVDPAPRLVQQSFASETETVFENEAERTITTTSVLYGVHLASYRTVDSARAGWRKLQRENPDELGLLEPRVLKVTIEGRGDFIRLIGGGFSSEEKASQLCGSLREKGVFCTVAGFEGERLSLGETG